MLELKQIRKSFGQIEVLQGVDLQARPGEVHALLGENGAGKSTLMKILCGIIKPTDGEILIDGKDIALPITMRPSPPVSASSFRNSA